MELSVSILNSQDRKEMVKLLNKANIKYIHVDVMDGIFVSQKTFNIEEIRSISQVSDKKLDVHLMVENPLLYIENIKDLTNIEYITIHLEINKDIHGILTKIKSYGFKAGISIKPNTDIRKLLPYLEYIDLLLVMTVEPGLGGQPFISSSSNRLKEIEKLTKNYNIKLEVDGGINNHTIQEVELADIAVVGSYITSSNNPIDKINSLLV